MIRLQNRHPSVAWPRLELPSADAVHRALLFLGVILTSAVLVALAVLPTVSSAGRALKRFDRQFLTREDEDLELPPFPERSTVYAADGSVLARLFSEENRKVISLDSVNHVTRDAVLAIEDDAFYEHGPVDFSSILRALLANLKAGEVVQGGSTISQQLIKNTQTGSAQTFARKLQEAQAAIRLEKTYTKDQILELYLNEIYLGHGVYGIGTASEYYFARPTKNLSLPQAALLAGMIAAPEVYDPMDDPDAALERRNLVLRRMLDLGRIDPERYNQAVNTPIELSAAGRAALASSEPYFVKYIKQQLLRDTRLGATYEDRYNAVFAGGLRIHTTLSPFLQEGAKAAVSAYLPDSGLQPPADPSAAVASIVPQTGAIRSIVGGSNFSRSQVDLASQGRRPTGSAFKPFALVAALEQGVPPGRVYDSAEPVFIPECDDWTVSNAEPGNDGYMNLWDATSGSVNVIFAQLARDVGPEHIADAAERMGISADLPALCSLTLGTVPVSPLDMTSAYGTLANEGVHCEPFAIARVLTRNDRVVLSQKPSCRRAIDPDIAAQVNAMLRGVMEGGTGWRAAIGRPAAGKTGTGQDFRDAWFLGYVPQLVTGVWVGYPKGQISMSDVHGIEVYGGTYPAMIWHDFMTQAVSGLPVQDFSPPPAPETGIVPSVIGHTQGQAEAILAGADFTAVATEVNSFEPAGTVVSQSPGGGTTATLGTAVTIYVSTGVPPQAEVPDVVGMTQEEAVAKLEELGFDVAVESKDVTDQAQDGIVTSQAPAAGTVQVEGGTVTIVVGKLAATPTPSPSPSPSPSPTGGG
jgi:penicillin-binding protein 1A